MDIEQLKMILDLLEKAGESGADLFVFYLLLDKIPGMIGAGLLIGSLFYVIKLGRDFVKIQSAGEKLREAAGVQVLWGESELNAAIKCLQTHYKDFRYR